ncbi:MAG: RrF2 family transcriptional regulator [Clostridia bacterium]|nr:RrF2 family transcriptional regulator [Clostridia bacterium]
MMVSTRGRYALRVMVELAEHGPDGYVAMKDVAEKHGISLKYLEKILPVLVANGLIEGVTGKGGGYRLLRKPEEYRIGEILRLTEGDLVPVACMANGAERCTHECDCRTHTLWSGLTETVNDYLDGVTLADLMRKEQ